jgi:hypothetical protein
MFRVRKFQFYAPCLMLSLWEPGLFQPALAPFIARERNPRGRGAIAIRLRMSELVQSRRLALLLAASGLPANCGHHATDNFQNSAMGGPASLGKSVIDRMPTVVPASSAIAFTADHKKGVTKCSRTETDGEISTFVCMTGDAIMASNAGSQGWNHFHHPRRTLCRRSHEAISLSLEGADRLS